MKNKIILVIFLILVVVIICSLLFIFVLYDKYKMPEGAKIEINKEDILAYTENIKLQDLIKDTNIDIITDDYEIDTKTVGKHTETIEYKYNSIRKYKYDITYNVIDTTAPIFISGLSSTYSFYAGETAKNEFEEKIDDITYADDCDIKPELTIEGDIDYTKPGKYNLKIIISDSSGNETAHDIQVTLLKKQNDNNDSASNNNQTNKETEKEDTEEDEDEDDGRIAFSDHIKKYKTKNTMVGIDVSKWQEEIDFEKIKKAGCEFVILRIGVMKDKDSELVKDSNFDKNYKNAKKAGLKVGLYVYSEANNIDTAISNAEFIIDTLDGDKLDLPVSFDWESWTYFNDMEINLHMLNEMYDAFSEKLEEAGYETMLYASEYYLNNVWLELKDYKIWIAKYSSNYPEITNGDNQYTFWQCACTGKIDGINGDVDLDIYYK